METEREVVKIPDYRFRWNTKHPSCIARFDMSSLTPGALLKNLGSGGSTYDATIFGAPAYVNPLIKAKSSKCMEFFGVNEYLGLANPISGLAAFSLVAWINYDAWDKIFFCRSAAADMLTNVNSAGIFGFQVGVSYTVTRNKYPTGQTYMLAATKDASNNAVIYVNGRWIVSGTVAANPADANAYIGQGSGGIKRMDGRIDNWMAWSITLTPEQISSIWRSANPRL